MEGSPKIEANAEEAPYLKEAEAEAFSMWKEANAPPPLRLLILLTHLIMGLCISIKQYDGIIYPGSNNGPRFAPRLGPRTT